MKCVYCVKGSIMKSEPSLIADMYGCLFAYIYIYMRVYASLCLSPKSMYTIPLALVVMFIRLYKSIQKEDCAKCSM